MKARASKAQEKRRIGTKETLLSGFTLKEDSLRKRGIGMMLSRDYH